MKETLKLFSLAAVLCLITGCATQPKVAEQNSRTVATCYVCRYNNDLECVKVKVKDSTPHTDYQATTYYFCSEDWIAVKRSSRTGRSICRKRKRSNEVVAVSSRR